jgi:hypothetical protein
MNISRARKVRQPCRRSKASVVSLRPQHKSVLSSWAKRTQWHRQNAKVPRFAQHGKLDAGLSEENLNTLGKTILGLVSVLIVATMSRGFSRTPSITPSTIRLDCAYYNVLFYRPLGNSPHCISLARTMFRLMPSSRAV